MPTPRMMMSPLVKQNSMNCSFDTIAIVEITSARTAKNITHLIEFVFGVIQYHM